MKNNKKSFFIFFLIIILIISFSDNVLAQQQKRIIRLRNRPAPPIKFTSKVRISSYYGPRKAPAPGASTFHRGVDIAAPIGTPVHAVAAGTVIKARGNGSAGNEIKIKHNNGVETRYLHMHKTAVRVGDKVRSGQVIGTVGNSGNSTGPHLHFELKRYGRNYNPISIVLEKP